MSEVRPSDSKKKLYIETVGCQMNVLDSELVVGKLRDEGYELTDDIDQADTILYNTCSVRQHAEDKIYSALGRIRRLKERQARHRRSACSAAWPRRTRSRSSAGPRTSTSSSAPASSAGSPSCSTRPGHDGKPQMAVSLPRTAGSRETVTASFAEYDPLREPSMRPEPVPGVRPDHDGLRQVLHLLHRPLRPRPRAEPAARRDRRRGPACSPTRGSRKSPCSARPSTATSSREPDGRTARLSDLLARLHDIAGVERIKFITNFPNDMTDDLLQAVRDLPKVSRYLHVPAQSGCDEVLKRMKRMLHGRALRRDARPDPRDRARRRRLQRLHRRLLRRDRGVVPRSRVRAGRAGPVQEQLHLQVQPPAGHQGRHPLRSTTCPRRSRSGGTTSCWPSRTRSASRTTGRSSAGRSRSWSKGRASRPRSASAAGARRVRPADGPDRCDRIVVFEGPERLIGQFVPVEVEDAERGDACSGRVVDGRGRGRVHRAPDGRRGWRASSRTWSALVSTAVGDRPRAPADPGASSTPASGAVPTPAGPGPTRAARRAGSGGTASPSPRRSKPGSGSPTGSTASGPADPPALGDRPDGPVRPGARPGGPARELVRAGQPERRDRLHRPGLSLAGRRLPALHLGRRPARSPPRIIAHELRRLVPPAPPPRRRASTGSTPASPAWATPGPSTAEGAHPPAARPPPTPDPRAGPLIHRGLDDRAIAAGLGISRTDAEAILRHLQHAPADYAESRA